MAVDHIGSPLSHGTREPAMRQEVIKTMHAHMDCLDAMCCAGLGYPGVLGTGKHDLMTGGLLPLHQHEGVVFGATVTVAVENVGNAHSQARRCYQSKASASATPKMGRGPPG